MEKIKCADCGKIRQVPDRVKTGQCKKCGSQAFELTGQDGALIDALINNL